MSTMRFLRIIPAAARAGFPVCVALLLCISTLSATEPNDSKGGTGREYAGDQGGPEPRQAPAQVVVKFGLGATPTELFGHDPVLSVPDTMGHAQTYLLELVPGANVDSAAAAMSEMDGVEYAHPNYLINRLHPVQGSYPFSDYSGTGDYDDQAAAQMLRLNQVHGTATGAGMKVGVIDVGIDFTHPRLSTQATSGYDFVDGDADATDESGGLASGHGTFVAGVIHLVAPDAEIVAYRIADQDGYGDGFTLARAIERAADDGCRVINVSLVLMKRHLAVRDAIAYAESRGATVVVAAGNQGRNELVYPAAEAGVLAVAAVDSNLHVSPFSTFGPQISVCAPGAAVYSTYLDGIYAWWSGTSFSAPFAAGLAALMCEVAPSASVARVRGAVELTAQNIDGNNPGYENLLGGGIIDPVAAIEYMSDPEGVTVTPDTVYFEHQVGRMILVLPSTQVWLQSTNAPALYWAEPADPDPFFAWVYDSVGTTNDSVTVVINPIEVAGTYTNRILFHVQGVAEPAELTIHLTVTPGDTSTTAWALPRHLYFQSRLGTEVLQFGSTFLQSSNAPAAYTATVLEGGAQVTSLPVTSGFTNDSVTIVVDPSKAPALGMYEDTVAFFVDGVMNPVPVFVILEIVDSLPGDTTLNDSAWVLPRGGLVLEVSDLDSLYACVSINSTNAPAAYFVEVADTPDFVRLLDSGGVTNASVCFVAAQMLPAGVYADTLLFYVDGVRNNPVFAAIQLTVISGGSAYDPLVLIDTASARTGSSVVLCLRALPGGFDWGGFDFLLKFDPALLTYTGAIAGEFLAGCGWEYFQPTLVSADSGLVRLVAVADLVGVPGQPSCKMPDPGQPLACLQFEVKDDSAPACRSVPVRFWWQDCGDNAISNEQGDTLIIADDEPFTVIDLGGWDITGLPHIGGPPWPCPSGTYAPEPRASFFNGGVRIDCDTIVPPPGGDSAWAVPQTVTVSAPVGSTDTVAGWVYLSSSNAPARYFAYVLGWPSFAAVPDSVGMTNDSVMIMFNPAGLSLGTYHDSLMFEVQGVANPVLVHLQLQMYLSDSLPLLSVSNYPNPFNPATNIAFTLNATSAVELHIYNILGERIATLARETLPAGEHRFVWDGRTGNGSQAGSGVYFYRLRVNDRVHTGKMLMMK